MEGSSVIKRQVENLDDIYGVADDMKNFLNKVGECDELHGILGEFSLLQPTAVAVASIIRNNKTVKKEDEVEEEEDKEEEDSEDFDDFWQTAIYEEEEDKEEEDKEEEDKEEDEKEDKEDYNKEKDKEDDKNVKKPPKIGFSPIKEQSKEEIYNKEEEEKNKREGLVKRGSSIHLLSWGESTVLGLREKEKEDTIHDDDDSTHLRHIHEDKGDDNRVLQRQTTFVRSIVGYTNKKGESKETKKTLDIAVAETVNYKRDITLRASTLLICKRGMEQCIYVNINGTAKGVKLTAKTITILVRTHISEKKKPIKSGKVKYPLEDLKFPIREFNTLFKYIIPEDINVSDNNQHFIVVKLSSSRPYSKRSVSTRTAISIQIAE